ncbi:alpha/beta fold hydrolase [Streptomyces sp. N2-109]|uniref:Alpha/beta fold hydrolase n=1 Tax=Streptomyces gossypii TaxID=2883101 RepID=A0ABT2K3I1_9ACTN|nr:S9 family peptidase [Streptomyces gossypii]MCT2594024.1 alpha/beta fold hydrolase [Streptomyces gossypii]
MDIAADHPDFPRQFARTRRFSLGAVRNLTVSPDGERVLFIRSGGGSDPVGRLWVWEAGGERLLADPYALGAGTGGAVTAQERARRERARDLSEGVSTYATDAAGDLVAFALGGLLWTVRSGGGHPVTVAAEGPVADPRPSPDGRLIAYVTGGALRVVAPDGSGERLLAAPENTEVTYGLTDYVSAEEMGRVRGFWWAPDSKALLVARVDTTRVRRRYLSDPAQPQLPPRVLRYPAAGTANAEVSLHLLTLGTGSGGAARRAVDWDGGAFEYLPAAGWDAHGPLAAVQSRDQRTLRVLAVDTADGSTRILHEQRDRDWVELLPGTPCRTASGALVHPVESEDTRRLRVGDETVTPAGLQVTGVLGTAGEDVLFTGVDDPVEEHVWRYSPASGCVRLSGRPGKHEAASGGPTTVLDGLTEDGQEVTVVRGGARVGSIGSLTEAPVLPPRPEFLTLGERRLRSALFLPSGHPAGGQGAAGGAPLPVLVNPYGGPGMRLVLRARHWHACVSQWFADQGFAVLVTDGRGTPGRGPEWEKAVRGDQLTPVMEDQIDALRAAAATRPCLDTERVAIRGWSFGGTLAAAAVLRHPDVFHAAVSGAGPTDQRLYDTHWKERFLGHPDEEPENYDRCSLLAEAASLTRPLLLVHGMADDNVTIAHTLRFSAALLAAGREHSVLPLSGASHLVKDETTGARLLEAELGFLRKALCR